MKNLGRAVKSTALIALLAFMIITHTACGDEGPPSKTDFCLDTSCTITIYDDMDRSDAEQLLEDSFNLMREKENLLSRTVEGSEVDQINGADGEWTEVSAETIDIIRTANMISYESGGVFDITIGKITQLWDFKAEEPEVPADEDIQAALPYIDYKTITTGGGKVKLSDPEAEIDLGGVAKGAIADMVCAFLEANGVTSAVVNLGGNVVVIGEKAEDTPWTVGIERPFTDRKELVGVVQVTDKAVVTSGIYERNFEAGDKIYHHILDPETGYPAETDLEAVTIIANKGYSGFCDAVSTACLILGSEKAPQFIGQLQEQYPDRGIEAAFIDNSGNIVQTDGMDIVFEEKKMRKIDIIVPCYNEGNNIEIFFEEVQRAVSDIEGYAFSYIFIDDGSTDDTLEKIKTLVCDGEDGESADGCKKKDVHYISFSRNFGKEAAMYAGLKAASDRRADYAVIIDADLQHPPQLIKDMIRNTEETGCDSCAARRVTRKGEPRIRSVFARAFYKIMNRYSDIEIIDGAVDFRLMNSKMIKAIVSMPENQRFSKGIFAWVGFHTEWIEFENVKRLSGESKWSVWSLTKYAIAGFLDFAASPLKAVGVFGGVTSVGAAIYLIIEILKTLIMGIDVPGYASIICLILFFGGLITAVLSIMGEYIGRMYMETKGRPIYIEKESDLDD